MTHLPIPAPDAWFDARTLYRDGFPEGLTSALQVFEPLWNELRRTVRALRPECVLEVGPGDRPIVDPGPGTCYLDVSPGLLRRLEGARVEGSVTHAPFADGMFDLVVAADVFSHIRPELRRAALSEMLRVSARLLIFNPEPGGDALSAPVAAEELGGMLEEQGARVHIWPIQIPTGQGRIYRFGLIQAER